MDEVKRFENLAHRRRLSVKPGLTFTALQTLTHEHVARILLEHGIIRQCDAATAVESGLTSVFLPHGIGHLLGLLVHDVAGKQSDPAGTPIPPDPHVRFKYLRSYRTMAPGMLFTVEPGIYFRLTLGGLLGLKLVRCLGPHLGHVAL